MKKTFESPVVDFIPFDFSIQTVMSGSPEGHYDANGKWHDGGNGNKHYDGVNYDGPNNGRGIGR